MLNLSDVKTVSSYRYPVCKLIISVAILVIVCFKNHVFSYLGISLNIFINILFAIVACVAFLCIVTSLMEIHEYHNKHHKNMPQKSNLETYFYTIDSLGRFVENSDIVEIALLIDAHQVTIGASSESNRSNRTFYNKEYFVDEHIFKEFNEFYLYLSGLLTNKEQVQVITIDGVSPKYYSLD